MANEIKLHNVDNLTTMLKSLSTNAQRRVVASSLRRAAARLRTYMRRRVPKETGELRKSIGVRGRKTSKTGKVRVGLTSNFYYGVLDRGRKAYKRNGKPVRGTENFKTIGTGIEETWNAHKQETAQMIVDQMKINIFKEWGKLAGRVSGG
jgi:hypothetical protein